MIKKYKNVFFVFLIFLMGFVLRTFDINWDQNNHLHPDERMLVMVTEQVKFDLTNFFSPDSLLNPKFFAYGSFPIYLLKTVSFFFSFIIPWFATYDGIAIVGRILSALADSMTIFLVFKITQKIFNSEKKAILASLIYCIFVLPIQLSHFFAVDTFLTFFVILTLYFSLKFYEKNSLKNALLVGIGFGLSLATKISAAVVILSLGMALIIDLFLSLKKEINKNNSNDLKKFFLFWGKFFNFKFWKSIRKEKIKKIIFYFSFIVLITVIVFCVCEPYAIIDFADFWKQISDQKIMTKNPFVFPYTLQYVNTPPYFYQIKNIFLWGIGPSFGILMLVGFVFTFSKLIKGLFSVGNEESEGKQLIIFSFFVVYFYIIGGFAVKFMRYCLPLYPIFSVLIASFLVDFQSILNKRKNLFNLILILFFLGNFVYLFAFLNLYKVPNTRVSATEWIDKNIPSGSLILREHWDDGLPLVNNLNLRLIDLPLYNSDNDPAKWIYINGLLSKADYIIIASNRLSTPLRKLTDCNSLPKDSCYIKTAQYYEDLFSGKLGFVKVAEFENFPSLFGFKINDQSADESFTVYDHPKISIFKKNEI